MFRRVSKWSLVVFGQISARFQNSFQIAAGDGLSKQKASDQPAWVNCKTVQTNSRNFHVKGAKLSFAQNVYNHASTAYWHNITVGFKLSLRG